jgi:kynurenine formamidase
MKGKYIASIFLFAYLALACGEKQEKHSSFPSGRWIDLTHNFSSETIYWPTAKTFTFDTVFVGFTEKNFYYSAFQFCAAEHGGTHLDAPIHFAKGRKTVDQIPLEQFIGPAVVIDISVKALKDRDYLVSIEDFTEWEAKHGALPEDVIVLLRTGYGQFWPDRVKYMGTDQRGQEAVTDLHFPGLDPDAARWLVEKRKISAIGLDTPSIDYGQSQLFESHQILFAENIPAFENVANLDQLPETGAFVIALPMKIKGGSGAPLRIVGFLPAK